jgi:hypothetical protein
MDYQTMILLSNGCSFTWGAGLDDNKREELIYPKLLSNKLKRKLVNLSIGCSSNQRIFRTTFDWINKQNKKDLRNTLAIIQLTDESRYEYYVPNNNKDIDDNWSRVKVGVVISPNEDDHERSLKRSNFRLETFTDLEASYHMLNYVSALSYLLYRHQIKHYFWSPNAGSYNYSTAIKDFIFNSQHWIPVTGDFDKVDGYNDPHPSELGHKQIAEQILNFIK